MLLDGFLEMRCQCVPQLICGWWCGICRVCVIRGAESVGNDVSGSGEVRVLALCCVQVLVECQAVCVWLGALVSWLF